MSVEKETNWGAMVLRLSNLEERVKVIGERTHKHADILSAMANVPDNIQKMEEAMIELKGDYRDLHQHMLSQERIGAMTLAHQEQRARDAAEQRDRIEKRVVELDAKLDGVKDQFERRERSALVSFLSILIAVVAFLIVPFFSRGTP